MDLPSAEDTTSSTDSRLAGTSKSSPEEFPVEPHKESKDEAGSLAPLPEGQNQIELVANDSPEESPTEPGEDEIRSFRTKPLPKVNAVAREVRVKATGARAGNVSGERELFTESTTTVLVFEKGGVLRLAAAVTPGQLLFLTNEETLREIVTQVVRKRTYRPTECYVEIEFTEPTPGFWGMEFSAATALLPKDAKELAAAEMVASAETTADELEEAAPPPSAEEIEALKREVAALRSQLQLLQTQGDSVQAAPTAPLADGPAEPSGAAVQPMADVPSASPEPAPDMGFTAKSLPVETAPEPPWVAAANQGSVAKPALVFRKALPPRKRSFRARGQFTPGFRTGMLRLAVLSSILAVLVATVWYKRWLPWMHEEAKFSVSTWAGGVTTKMSMPEESTSGPVSAENQATKTTSGNDAAVVKETSPSVGLPSEAPGEAASGSENAISSGPHEVMPPRVSREKSAPPASIARPSPVHSLPVKRVDSAPTSVPSGILVPPKLIKSERAVASLDDLRDFETGSVLIDATIDTAGDVTSPNVLSGPPSLRRPALEALKHYKYEPAMQNGKPVPAHVTVKILFHFE